jgi:peptidoglycan/LPS O-acetylase OafA/YrhL
VNRRLGYRPELDGLRALAVTLVLFQHTGDFLVSEDGPRLDGGPWFPGGFLGVDLFFVLSGFLITTLLLEERRATGGIRLTAFYERRALRLLPALGVLLAGTTAWVALTGGALRDHLRGALAATLYVWNWAVAAGVDVGDFGHGHLWSLAVEEQFYLVWPFALVTLALVSRRRPHTMVGWCLLGAAAAAVHRSAVAASAGVGDAYVRTDTRADALLVGAALGAGFVSWGRLPRWAGTVAPVAAVALVGLAATTSFTDRWLYDGGFTVVALLGALLVAGAVAGSPWLHPLLTAPSVVRLGTLSYTAYLLHYPVFEAVGDELGALPWPGRVVVGWSVAAAAVLGCHRFVEVPFLRLKERRRAQSVTASKANW